MCMTPKEHILRCAGEYWSHFNKKPYNINDFFKILEREGIEPAIFCIDTIEYDELEHLSFDHDNWIFVNGCGSIYHKGDILVFNFAKLFHWYYIHEPGFLDFHNCLGSQGEEYRKLCLTAGFLAVVPSRVLINDLRKKIDLADKYSLSYQFAYRRTELLHKHLLQLNGRNSQNNLRKRYGEEGVVLCAQYMESIKDIVKDVRNRKLN